MKLTYKILWIDNDDSIYQNHQDDIYEHLEDLGFEPQIEILQDFQSFQDADLDLKSYDLFILDYKLKNGENGNQIVQEIREEHSIYTEIIFYSGVPDEARQQIFDDRLNGVYITSRKYDEFEDDVLGIIDVTIKKVQDVNNLRGLIMAEVAELDRIKKRIIKKFTSQVDDSFKLYIKDNVFAQLKGFFDEFDWVKKEDDSYKVINLNNLAEHFIFDSAKKARTVYKIKRKIPACSSNEYIFQEYKKNIIDKRNVLAHQEEETRDDGIKILKYPNGKDLEFTPEHCIQIRKDIKRYKKLLEEINSKIEEI